MPNTNNRKLTLTQVGANVRIDVTYNAVFSTVDRRLVGLGVRFVELIAVIGVDPPGAVTGRVLAPFENELIPVTEGTGIQELKRSRSLEVPRFVLDEDQNPLFSDPDEIRCRIRIVAIDLTPRVTPDAFTNQQVLDDGVIQP
jgi:hypothetical protein